MLVVRAARTGGPEVLKTAEVETPAPGPGQVLIRHRAIGLNFIDTYFRTGLYPAPMPAILGAEGAGVVEAVGEGVTRFKTGDRVAYAGGLGAYAEARLMPADRVVALPEAIDFDTAAAVMLKGMTAEFLVRRCYPVKAGEAVLVHAAAGGVGVLLTQWCKALGATVIATVGSEDKAEVARGHGADHVILYRHEDVAARVREITGGAGVRVAYDGVGKDTAEASLRSLGKRGYFVSYGNASGPVDPIPPLRLSQGGSLFMTRPTMFDYQLTIEEQDDSAAALFGMLAAGKLKVDIGQRFALKDARRAHEALESRSTVGATVLEP